MSDIKNIHGFIITASHEIERKKNVLSLQSQLQNLMMVEAIYPSKEKVPFLKKMQALSKERTGRALNNGEIGVLLSNRKIWRQILQSNCQEHDFFLILESDSVINNLAVLEHHFYKLVDGYDLFFFGAWLGHAKLLRSKRKQLDGVYHYGEPYIKTICSGYGYALNKKAAAYLLKQTGKIGYPADEFKKYMDPGKLKIGAVSPELISQGSGTTTIGHAEHPILQKIWVFLLDIRNSLICYFR